jgi:OmpA-OmpF porin, OOP family
MAIAERLYHTFLGLSGLGSYARFGKIFAMKKLLVFLVSGWFFIATVPSAHAQLADRIKQKVKDKANQRADQKADEAIDKTMDDADNSGKSGNQNNNKQGNSNQNTNTGSDASGSSAKPTLIAYSRYDFVPGDKIIFQDDLKEEKEGEFPSQFSSSGGQGQVVTYNGEKVFQTLADGTVITPRIKGMSYLPDQFTVEFDAFVEGSGDEVIVKFDGVDNELTLYSGNAEFGNFNGNVPKEVADQWYPEANNYSWRHYAIAVNKTLMKAYIDQYRVLNVPSFEGKPTSVSFNFRCSADGADNCRNMFLKNFRIAAGGIDLYRKVESEGRIVTHGITFDVDKATIKPESMGTLNQIADLMKNNGSLKFEIDGHTDNSGSSQHNQALSQERANAVKAQLVKMGVDGSRFTTKGFGDTKPLSENTTPEGRANNRRVEFVKI